MRTAEKRIEGRDGEGKPVSVLYRSCTHGARVGLDILIRLAKLLGPGIGALGDAMGLKGAALAAGALPEIPEGELPGNLLERAAKALLATADSQETIRLMMDVLARTQRTSPAGKIQEVAREDIFDEVYCENYGELLAALVFALEVNYGSFFGVGGLIGRIMDRVRAPLTTT